MDRLRSLPVAIVLSFLPIPALANDRPPTAEERSSIEAVLKAEGFTRWDEIEWDDDGHWEVDDAAGVDGVQYDLKLDASFAIIRREAD